MLACLIAGAAQPLLSCATQAQTPRTPAVIVNPGVQTAAELDRVIREALGGRPVRLSADALTASNVLIVEHARPRDPAGRLLDGRELRRPESFELFRRGSWCVLIRSKTGREWRLHHAQCIGAPAAPR